MVFKQMFSFSLKFNLTYVNTTEMASYLLHFNREFFFKETSELTVVKSVRYIEARYYFNELFSNYSKELSELKIKLEDVDRNYKHDFAYFNVMFIDSYDSFR